MGWQMGEHKTDRWMGGWTRAQIYTGQATGNGVMIEGTGLDGRFSVFFSLWDMSGLE